MYLRPTLPARTSNLSILTAIAICVWTAGSGCDSTSLQRLTGGLANDSAANPQSGFQSDDAPPNSPDAASESDAALREIEEADLVKVVDDKIYVLNRLKGLIIVDAADPDAPTIKGKLELRGQPIEMYVVGERAYVLLSADIYYYGYPAVAVGMEGDARTGIAPAPDYQGSQVAAINLSDLANPSLISKVNLAGYASQSRRVGDVLYVSGQNIPSYETPVIGDDPAILPPDYYYVDRGFIASLNIADPDNMQAVDREVFQGGSVEMHVSSSAIFAAAMQYDGNTGRGYTRVQYVDITDAAGQIVLRDAFEVNGRIRNRFYMDDYNGVFRIATENFGFGTQEARLYTYDLADPDDVKPLGQTQIIQNESLEAVRFDGPRGYAVTFFRVDPLFVIDLSDPANPAVKGELEVPGFSTHIEPRGDRLIAVGIDDTQGQRPAVAYYDVSNPAAPTQLGRVILGPPDSFVESEAVYDEKAFKIIDDLGLIAIPFSHVDYTVDEGSGDDGSVPPSGSGGGSSGSPGGNDVANSQPDRFRPRCTNAVQLIDFSDSGLTQRGWFDARARVQRVGLIFDRLFAVSDASLQTINIADRDHPTEAGEAAFFSEDEQALVDFSCGYWGYPIPIDDPVIFPFPFDSAAFGTALRALMENSDMCGTVTALPGAMLVLGMVGMRHRRRRRR